VTSGEVKRHVHVADEMDQKLEGVLDVAWHGVWVYRGTARASAESLELLEHGRGITNRVQDVDVRPAIPALWTGESTGGTGVVVYGADVMEGAGPSVFALVADAVGPCCDWREVALSSVVKDVAEFGHHARVEIHLRNGRDDFMACVEEHSEWAEKRVSTDERTRTNGAPGI